MNQNTLPIIAALLLAPLAALHASAGEVATYYVSQSSGNDSWDGRAPVPDGMHGPWKTLGKASQTYLPGDRILLKCGDRWGNDTLRPKGSGTPDNPIVIASYGTDIKPLLDGLDDKQGRIGIHLVDVAGYKIAGLEFARYRSGIFAHYGADQAPKRYLWVEDCFFHDSTFYPNYRNYLPNKPWLGIILWTDETKQRIVISDITIRNCRFERMLSAIWSNNPDNFNMQAGGIYNFGTLVIENCTTDEGLQWQLGLRGVDSGAIRNCVFHDTGRHFQSWNGVAGAMIQRCRNLTFVDSEWGFVSIGDPGKVSGDGHYSDEKGASCQLAFSGSAVTWIGVKIMEGYPEPPDEAFLAANGHRAHGGGGRHMIVFERGGGARNMRMRDDHLYIRNITRVSPGVFRFHVKEDYLPSFKGVSVGNWVSYGFNKARLPAAVLAAKDRSGSIYAQIAADRVENIAFRDIDMFGSINGGIRVSDMPGDVTLRDVRIVRKPGTRHLLSTISDALHLMNIRRGLCGFAA